MADVLQAPNRSQLEAFLKKDSRSIRAFELLFKTKGMMAGDVIYAAAQTRAGALPAQGGAFSRQLYSDLYSAIVPAGVVTITIASPGVVTWATHGLAANTKISFVTSGALPTGLVAGTIYFVKTVLTASTFTVSATAGGAVINTSGTQSGVHTATAFPYGNGDGTTTFNVPTVAAVGGCNAFIIY